MTRRELARAIARRNRQLAIDVRPLVREDFATTLDDLPPVERARAIRCAARSLVAGDDAWALVWIQRARQHLGALEWAFPL